jgi:hypothetical protein
LAAKQKDVAPARQTPNTAIPVQLLPQQQADWISWPKLFGMAMFCEGADVQKLRREEFLPIEKPRRQKIVDVLVRKHIVAAPKTLVSTPILPRFWVAKTYSKVQKSVA